MKRQKTIKECDLNARGLMGIHTHTHTQTCIRNELVLDSSESWQNKLGLIAVNEQRMKSVKLILHHLHPGEGNERVGKGREMWLREELQQSKMPLSVSLAFFVCVAAYFRFFILNHSPFFFFISKFHPILQLFGFTLYHLCVGDPFIRCSHLHNCTRKPHNCCRSAYDLCVLSTNTAQ